MDYDILVVGSGPAGAQSAERLSRAGRRVALVTVTPPGGRTAVGSLVPSKAWLHAASHRPAHAKPLDDGAIAGIAGDVRTIVERRTTLTRTSLEKAGVAIVQGQARLRSAGESGVDIEVIGGADGERVLTCSSRELIVATGSEPLFSPLVRPDGDRIIAPRHMSRLARLPRTLVMVGGGITGVEYASVFARLGSRVTLLSRGRLLPRVDPDHAALIEADLARLGVTVRTGRAAIRVEGDGDGVQVTDSDGASHSAAMAFIATGRAADLALFDGAAQAPRRSGEGRWLAVDSAGRTSLPGIYACGDVAGPPFTANAALRDARRVVATILGQPAVGVDDPLIEAVYTEPGLAWIGPVPDLAHDGAHRPIRRSYAVSVLSSIGGHEAGELKVWLDRDGRIVGAATYGPQAAEVLAPVQLAMHHGIPWDRLNAVPLAYPTLTEVVTS